MGLLAWETIDKKTFISGMKDSIFPGTENWVCQSSFVTEVNTRSK